MKRVLRRLVLVVAGCVLALVALELVLQVVAWVVWSRRLEPAPAAGGGERVVLCAGDSFTWGMGADDRAAHAWPAVLETDLRRSDPALRVVNVGYPGTNSATVADRLPQWLAQWRPVLVYVLIGYNDFHDTDVRPGGDHGFPLELRTLRLFGMVAAWLRGVPDEGPPPSADEAPLEGLWHVGGRWFDFRDSGVLVSDAGELDLVWHVDGDRLVLTHRALPETVTMHWRVADDALHLEGGLFPDGIVLSRGLPLRDLAERGFAAEYAGDDRAALDAYREALAVPELAEPARRGLVRIHARRGDRERVVELLAPWRQRFAERPDTELAKRLVEALLRVGDHEPAFAVIARALREAPLDDDFVELVTRAANRAPSAEAFEADVDAALARADLTPAQRRGLIGVAAVLSDDPDRLAERLVQLAGAGVSDQVFARIVRTSGAVSREALERAAAALAPDARADLLARFDAARSTEDSTNAVLAVNLRAIVAACRAAGVEPVLLDYPRGRDDVREAVRVVATELGVDWIDVRSHFSALLRTAAVEDLFVVDGHCNDRGYVAIGELVAADARRRLALR